MTNGRPELIESYRALATRALKLAVNDVRAGNGHSELAKEWLLSNCPALEVFCDILDLDLDVIRARARRLG